MLEMGVGSGRVAVPTALAGVPVVGRRPVAGRCSTWPGRRPCHTRAAVRLVRADMRDLPDLGSFALVTVPFRALLHLRDDDERLAVLQRRAQRLRPGGRLAFDVFHPDRIDIEETHGRWLEREPGIHERALGTRRAQPDADGAHGRARGDYGAVVGGATHLGGAARAGRLLVDRARTAGSTGGRCRSAAQTRYGSQA